MGVPAGEKKAAREALKLANLLSIDENFEYGVLIYIQKGKYVAGESFTSDLPDAIYEHDILAAIQKLPKGVKIVAFCHTHAAETDGTDAEYLSRDDVKFCLVRKIRG